MDKVPLDDSIAYAIARLVDDAMVERRLPSHSEIEFEIRKAGLIDYDPNKLGRSSVGKMKRVRTILIHSLEKFPERAEKFAYGIISLVKANGGFRQGSPNYVGKDAVENLVNLLKPKGILLGYDGTISPIVLDGLSFAETTEALENYIERAKKGFEDAALIIGTSKDLMEAVAAHVLVVNTGSYPATTNFPTLLGQAFISLNMATPYDKKTNDEHPRKDIERNLYNLACGINRLRNKQGTGHGRPWLPDVTKEEAIESIQLIGTISGKMLKKLKETNLR